MASVRGSSDSKQQLSSLLFQSTQAEDPVDDVIASSEEEGLSPALRDAVNTLASVVTHRQTNSTALAAVMEVKVETTILSNHDQGMDSLRHTDYVTQITSHR